MVGARSVSAFRDCLYGSSAILSNLVLRGIPILKHCSWISAMQASALEVVEGGAMSGE
jgi:hypothetical protein